MISTCWHHYVPDLDGLTFCDRCGDSPDERETESTTCVVTELRAYPRTPHKCARCAARVYVYSTETVTAHGDIVSEEHFCRTCTNYRKQHQ